MARFLAFEGMVVRNKLVIPNAQFNSENRRAFASNP
jgi:hypothetical protein